MSVDEIIDAARIFHEEGALIPGQILQVLFGNLTDAHAARAFVGGESDAPKNLGELAGGKATDDIHLPQSVLGRHISLQENGILPRGGFDMWNAAGVALDDSWTADRCADFAGYFGQRPNNQPVYGEGQKHGKQSYAHINDAHSASQHFSILA